MKDQVYVKRKRDKKSFPQIASEVKNMKGERPYWKVCRDAYQELTAKGYKAKKDNYANCGRKRLLTDELVKWLIQKMLSLRMRAPCTSLDLQRFLLKEKGVEADESTIRRHLNNDGYYYLPRDQKPRYNKKERFVRVNFAKRFEDCSVEELAEEVHICLDGVVITKPPEGMIDRENYVHSDIPKVWRRHDEHDLPALQGHDKYKKQVPKARMIPLWGGLGPGGFATVLWHDERKTDSEEWSAMVRAGELTEALKAVNPGKRTGPWEVLCDNESFLDHDDSVRAYRRPRIALLHIPPKSPDLNPVEKFWGWVRKQVHIMDLADLRAGRPVPSKKDYQLRLKRLLRSQRAQQVARNFYGNLVTVSKRIVKRKGHAVKG